MSRPYALPTRPLVVLVAAIAATTPASSACSRATSYSARNRIASMTSPLTSSTSRHRSPARHAP